MKMIKTIITAASLAAAMAVTAVTATAGTVTKVNNVLTITGTIDQQTWAAWTLNYDAEKITHVKLDSTGGSVWFGSQIADDIKSNKKVVTEAIGVCTSMCGLIWLSADKHVWNTNGEIGFHYSYLDDMQYWKDMLYEWGFKNVESRIKRSATEDLMLAFEYFNNKKYFHEYMEGVKNDGDFAHKMWYPTETQLKNWEGPWVTAPKFEGYGNKGYGVNIPDQIYSRYTSTGVYEIKFDIVVTNMNYSELQFKFFDFNRNQLLIGFEETNIQYGWIYNQYNAAAYKYNVKYKQKLYGSEKPKWLQVTSKNGLFVKWIEIK